MRTPARTVAFGLIVTVLASGCIASRTEETLPPTPPTTHDLPDGEAFYFVEGVNPTGFIVDPAEFLTGEAARAAAEADGVIGPDEDLPNDFYIRNPDETTSLVARSTSALFTMLLFDATGQIVPGTMAYEDLVDLMEGLGTYSGPDVYGVVDGTFPADVVLENGLIISIGEVYLP